MEHDVYCFGHGRTISHFIDSCWQILANEAAETGMNIAAHSTFITVVLGIEVLDEFCHILENCVNHHGSLEYFSHLHPSKSLLPEIYNHRNKLQRMI